MRHSNFLLLLLITLCTSALHSRIVHVPSEKPTIQTGINACADGDTVLVADGTYRGAGNRDIDLLGKAIVVMSENGPEVTIIDCEGSDVDHHRGFHIHSGEGSTSVVRGFTITNGYAAEGGGMFISSSSPTVIDCIFTGNTADPSGYSEYGGGGLFNHYNSHPTIINCAFSGNTVIGSGSLDGGGGMFNSLSRPTVIHCSFTGNSVTGSSYGNGGGGMYNSFSSPTVTHCVFTENSATASSQESGGGGMYNDWSSFPTVINCIFSGNSAPGTGYGAGGGGMYNAADGGSQYITNCTFTGNSADVGGGMYNNVWSYQEITNCIFWGNIGGEIYSYSSSTIVTYSDVQGGHSGTGNIDADPLLVTYRGFDFLLRGGSPCIDAGDPAIEDGFDWPGWYANGTRSDMGAYGGTDNMGWLPSNYRR